MAAVHLPVGCLPHLHLLSQEEQQRLHHDVHNEQIQNGETLKSKWTQSVAQRRAGGTSGVISASLAVRGNEKRFRYHHILITDSTYSSYLWQLFKQTCWLLSAWFGLSAFGGAARFAFPWQHGDPLEGLNLNWFKKPELIRMVRVGTYFTRNYHNDIWRSHSSCSNLCLCDNVS